MIILLSALTDIGDYEAHAEYFIYGNSKCPNFIPRVCYVGLPSHINTLKTTLGNDNEDNDNSNRDRMVPTPPGPQVGGPSVTDAQDTSPRVQSRTPFQCEHCTRGFETKRGLSVHVRMKHPVEANRNVCVERTKKRWSNEEVTRLARIEAKALIDGEMMIPQILESAFPGRTLDGIKGQRKKSSYKALVERLKTEMLGEPEQGSNLNANRPSGSDSVHDENEAIKRAIMEDVEALKQSRLKSNRNLSEIAAKVVRDESDGSAIVAWWKQFFVKTRIPSAPIYGRTTSYRGNSRQKRRQHYAVVQKAFKKNIKDASRIVFKKNDSAIILPDKDVMLSFWREVFERSDPIERETESFPKSVSLEGVWKAIDISEVNESMLTGSAAAGPDSITPGLWNKQCPRARRLLYNLFIYLRRIPADMCIMRTTLIPKSEEGSTNPGDFRPISLSSVIIRQFNKIMANRVVKYFAFDHRQSAFIPVDGQGENTTVLTTLIHTSKDQLKELHLCSLDLAKAFDSVSHNSLVMVLEKEGFPTGFIEYVSELYANAKTIIQYEGNKLTVKINCGVLQGDPLSACLFNIILEQVLKSLSSDIGFRLNDSIINALAFADDTCLVASTVDGLQCNLNIFAKMLRKFGMSINRNKSAVLSIVPSGRDKKFKVIEEPSVKLDDEYLKQRTIIETWKHLGLLFDGVTPAPAKTKLISDLNMLHKAPLKPQQRLKLLRIVVIPRMIHSLVLGRINAKGLKQLDVKIRASTRNWLKLPHDIPIAYIHAPIASGGLGIPCLQYYIPVLRLTRLNKLRRSDRPFCNTIANTRYVTTIVRRCEQALSKIGCLDLRSYHKYWSDQLHGMTDGKDLTYTSNHVSSHCWVDNKSFMLSGKDYVHCHAIRTNSIPTRKRTARGTTNVDTKCRAGCDLTETPYHVIQQCHRTDTWRVLRHDKIVRVIENHFKGKGAQVDKEPVLATSVGTRKPDLIIKYRNKLLVLDAQVAMGSNLQQSHTAKVVKYRGIPGLDDMLKTRYRVDEVEYHACVLSYKGIWAKGSIDDLKGLEVPDTVLHRIVVIALQGSWLNWQMFNKINTVIRRMVR